MRAFLLLLLVSLGATAQDIATGSAQHSANEGSSIDQQRVNFVLGNIEFILIHELAHLAINEFDIPVIGPIEPAADYIATMSLVRPLKTPPVGETQWQNFAIDAAEAFVLAWEFYSASDQDRPYWDSHTLTIQRFYRMICLMYGSGAAQFDDLPARAKMPQGFADGCKNEFNRAATAIDRTLSAYGRHGGEPSANLLTVSYETPRSQVSLALRDRIRGSGLLEWTAGRFVEMVPINEPASIILRSCPRSDAAWMPKGRELVICYELLDVLYLLSLKQQDSLDPTATQPN